MFLTLPLLRQNQEISGWLELDEADALMCTAITVCMELKGQHSFVEIGSFQGKSTVLLANVLRHFSPGSKVYAIDPHEGMVGAEDISIQQLEPTLDAFRRNIVRTGNSAVVELINDYSTNVQWENPISLLFIDGLHDYKNVSADFLHFENFVRVGGYVVFHDCADYYVGVKRFVEEVAQRKDYQLIAMVRSIAVLKKIR